MQKKNLKNKGVQSYQFPFFDFRHDEEERNWLERERIAQKLFAQKKALEEAEKARKRLNESAELQTVNGTMAENHLDGRAEVNSL